MADRMEPVAWYLPQDGEDDSMFRDARTVNACNGNPWTGWIALHTAAQLAAAVAQARAEERSRYTALVDWLQDVGLLKVEHCQIDKPETLGDWWVLRKPYLIGQHVSYGKTEDEAIAAAIRQASEQATEGEKR